MADWILSPKTLKALFWAFLGWIFLFFAINYWLITPWGNGLRSADWGCYTLNQARAAPCSKQAAVQNYFKAVPRTFLFAVAEPPLTPFFVVLYPFAWRRLWFGLGLLTNPYICIPTLYLLLWSARRIRSVKWRRQAVPSLEIQAP